MIISQTPFIFLLLLLFPFFTPTHQNVSVSLSKTTLSESGDSVLIQWSGVDSPSKLDWLGIYSPTSSHHDNFIGYKSLSSSPTGKSGSGPISLPLVNLRSKFSGLGDIGLAVLLGFIIRECLGGGGDLVAVHREVMLFGDAHGERLAKLLELFVVVQAKELQSSPSWWPNINEEEEATNRSSKGILRSTQTWRNWIKTHLG